MKINCGNYIMWSEAIHDTQKCVPFKAEYEIAKNNTKNI